MDSSLLPSALALPARKVQLRLHHRAEDAQATAVAWRISLGDAGARVSAPPPSKPSLIEGMEHLFSEALRRLENHVGSFVFASQDREELEEQLDALLRDVTYARLLNDLRQAIAVMASATREQEQEEESEIAAELLAGAGAEREALLREAMALSDAIALAWRQAHESWMREGGAARLPRTAQQVARPPLWFVHDPTVPTVLKRAWYGAPVADACAFAVACARHGQAQDWQVRALLELWRSHAREYLRCLAGMPGVSLPAPLQPDEPLDLEAIQAAHEQNELAYQRRLAQARATGASVFPVPGDDDL